MEDRTLWACLPTIPALVSLLHKVLPSQDKATRTDMGCCCLLGQRQRIQILGPCTSLPTVQEVQREEEEEEEEEQEV